jgi:ribonuclease Z
MRLVVLGSSSARPTRTRHLSSSLVSTDTDSVLIDCGEGTQFQLMSAKAKTSRIRCVLITHLHGDHVFGLPGLLGSFTMDQRTAPLQVVGPPGIRRFIEFFQDERFGRLAYPIEVTEVEVSGLAVDEPTPILEAGPLSISCGPLVHRVETLGYRIELPDSEPHFDVGAAAALGVTGSAFGDIKRHGSALIGARRVELSEITLPARPSETVAVFGDTRPCDSGVALAKGADLLVHEATYLESERQLAVEYGHSTAREAAQIAAAAHVGSLLLTHFSPRYPDAQRLVAEARSTFDSTSAATELDWVPVRRPTGA